MPGMDVDKIKAIMASLPVSTPVLAILLLSLLFAVYYFFVRSGPVRIVGLYVYPVKSCAPIAVKQAYAYNRLGFEYDRQWLITDEEGRFRTQRDYPAMALIRPAIDAAQGALTLSAPGMKDITVPIAPAPEEIEPITVSIWDDSVSAVAYSRPALSTWLTNYLKTPTPCRLVKILSKQAHNRPLDKKYDFTKPEYRIQGAFQDGYPFLLASQSSLRALNRLQSARQIPMLAFRPNIVVDGPGLKPWDEDMWRDILFESSSSPSSSSSMRNAKLCTRCTMPLVDPQTGKRDKSGQPILVLREHRQLDGPAAAEAGEEPSVYFGINLEQLSSPDGSLWVGQKIRVTQRKMKIHEYANEQREEKEGLENEQSKKDK